MSQTTLANISINTQTSIPTTDTIPIPLLAEFNYYLPPPNGPGAPSTNDLELILGTKDQDTHLLPVIDLRTYFDDEDGLKKSFHIDIGGSGFTYVRNISRCVERCYQMTDEEIEKEYYPEVEDVVRNLFPNQSLQIYHLGHILRGSPRRTFQHHHHSPSNDPEEQPTDSAWNRPNRGTAPAPRVHIDFTAHGLNQVMSQTFGDEIANYITNNKAQNENVKMNAKRYIAFSIWRPIKRVHRDPLGLCDARTVRNSDIIPVPRIYPDGKTTENIVVKAGCRSKSTGTDSGDDEGESIEKCNHQWYYLSTQLPDEVAVIKIFDSAAAAGIVERDSTGEEEIEEKGIDCAPHCSFHVPGTEDVEDVRESIEVRVVVVFT